MQTIEANVSIQVPKEYVLVKRAELRELQEQSQQGRTCDVNEFRTQFCGGRSAEWVRQAIFIPFADEIDFTKGGWLINPHGGRGRKQLIFVHPASQWMDKNRMRIKWDERLIR